MYVITVEQLTKHYGRRVGIEDLTLAVPRGSIFGFLGPNGSGKTTTIRLLLGLLKPDRGRGRILERDCWRQHRDIMKQVGYVPGDLRLPSWMSARAALAILSGTHGVDLRTEGNRLVEDFGLEMDVRVRNMSRGMRQKLGLIMALAHRPEVLILDEPTSALDPIHQDKLYSHLRRLSGDGHTIFFSSHVLSEVEELCDRVAILREGHMVANETLERLRERATRHVTILWKQRSEAASEPPTSLKVHRRFNNTWEGTLTGSVGELLGWLAPNTVEDLFIGKPDLEDLFHRFYVDQEP